MGLQGGASKPNIKDDEHNTKSKKYLLWKQELWGNVLHFSPTNYYELKLSDNIKRRTNELITVLIQILIQTGSFTSQQYLLFRIDESDLLLLLSSVMLFEDLWTKFI